MRDLWSLRLQKLTAGIEDADQAEGASQKFSSHLEAAPDAEDGNVKKTATVGSVSPTLVETLGLCYLGMLLLRLPVSVGDIYRFVQTLTPAERFLSRAEPPKFSWATKEEILFFRAIRTVPLEMREKLPGEYHTALDTLVRWISSKTDMQHPIMSLSSCRNRMTFTAQCQLSWSSITKSLGFCFHP